MKYKVVFYCPDRHIEYDGDTPYKIGVGGGITSRVRMAKALADLGNSVVMIVNTPERRIFDGVEYIPLKNCSEIESDILVLNTSGGKLDLSPVMDMDIKTDFNILWVSGVTRPIGIENLELDYLYVKSNFLRKIVSQEWGVSHVPIFVSYNGVDDEAFRVVKGNCLPRDPFRLIYCSHPIKGLDTAIAVTKYLRRIDNRYHLKVFGGPELWGQCDELVISEEGIHYGGLIGQDELTRELFQSTFALNFQKIQEGFGLAIIESMRAGCIVLASYVGAFPEIIENKINGFLFEGDYLSEKLLEKTIDTILSISKDDFMKAKISANAMEKPISTITIATTWCEHWDMFISKVNVNRPEQECDNCFGRGEKFSDGYHCLSCGNYSAC